MRSPVVQHPPSNRAALRPPEGPSASPPPAPRPLTRSLSLRIFLFPTLHVSGIVRRDLACLLLSLSRSVAEVHPRGAMCRHFVRFHGQTIFSCEDGPHLTSSFIGRSTRRPGCPHFGAATDNATANTRTRVSWGPASPALAGARGRGRPCRCPPGRPGRCELVPSCRFDSRFPSD